MEAGNEAEMEEEKRKRGKEERREGGKEEKKKGMADQMIQRIKRKENKTHLGSGKESEKMWNRKQAGSENPDQTKIYSSVY